MLHSNLQIHTAEILSSKSFTDFAWVTLQSPKTFPHYQSWINNQMHADMNYLKTHAPLKETPELLLPKAQSALVICCNYIPHPQKKSLEHFKSKIFTEHLIAKYAQGEDYHLFFKAELKEIAAQLKELYPQEEFLAFTDSHPVLERDLAHKAGLGWFGKNTCLIDQKKGSFFFIGEIYSTLCLSSNLSSNLSPPLNTATSSSPSSISPPAPAQDRCGTCTRCMEACPTKALESPQLLNSNKCISYWTIEAKENPPEEWRDQIGQMYFGCDICQDVCPWNEKAFGKEFFKKPVEDQTLLEADLKKILNSSYKQLEKIFSGTALLRARGYAHKRNAILVACHYHLKNLLPDILNLKPDPRLTELVTWAEKNLS